MKLDISMEEHYTVPIERVWRALTDPQMIERWLMKPHGYEAKVGVKFVLDEAPRGECRGHVECEVLELSPPHRMVWSWRGEDHSETTHLVIELESTEQGAHLMLRHTGEADERIARETTAGWTGKLGALSELLSSAADQGSD